MSWELDGTVNRIFDNFIKDLNVARRGGGTRSGHHVNAWTPAIDVHETDKEFIINAELPGLKKDQVNVDVRDNDLIISGEAQKSEQYQEGSTHIQERRYGSFTRTISLPPNVKAEDITAKCDNGLLELKLPKTPSSTKKISIQ